MARRNDPWTSKEAQKSVKRTPEKAQVLLRVLKKPMTDEQMVATYQGLKKAPWASPSGLRTLRVELHRQGLIEDTGKVAKTVSGRKAIIWKATA
jgi:hypothetical protein